MDFNFNIQINNNKTKTINIPNAYRATRKKCLSKKPHYCVYCDKWCYNKNRHIKSDKHILQKRTRTIKLLIENINNRIKTENDEVIIYNYRKFILILRERLEKRHWCNKCNYYTDRHDNLLTHLMSDKHDLNTDELVGKIEPDCKMNGEKCHFVYLN